MNRYTASDFAAGAALGVWLGSAAMAAVVAAITFPAMKTLDPQLPRFAQYTGDHWMIAAGQVANTTFFISDWVQAVCCLVVLVSVGWNGWRRWKVSPRERGRTLARAACLLIAVAGLGYSLAILRPRMASNLTAYWTAAADGRSQDADLARSAFNADHPLASNAMAITAAGVIATLVAVGVTGSPQRAQHG